MLKRRIGEHDAELRKVARDGRREREGVGGTAVALVNSAPAQQHNGADAAGEQIAFSIVDMTAQLGHRLLVGSVTG